MRLNVYSDELTSRMEIVERETQAGKFIGIRIFIETPVTIKNEHGMKAIFRGPFEKEDGDDDSSAVTFWARAEAPDLLLKLFRKAALELSQAISPHPG